MGSKLKKKASPKSKKAVAPKKLRPSAKVLKGKEPVKTLLKAKPAKSPPAAKVAKAIEAPKPKKLSPSDQKRELAAKAMEAAMAATGPSESAQDDDEFDPAAFFAASGGQGVFRAHIMRKERVDLGISVRYRFLKGPLVYNAELLNLSKGGLALETDVAVKSKTVLKVEIPLPHTSELFAVQAEVIWSENGDEKYSKGPFNTGLRFLPMSLAKQTVINQFIQQRRDEIIMTKIGLEKFAASVPVAGLD